MDSELDNGGGEWLTAPAEADDGNLVMVSGREDVGRFRSNPRFKIRVTVSWDYSGESAQMPTESTGELMARVQQTLTDEFRHDPVAVLTGIYTGDGQRQWVFYTLSIHIFGRKLNELLEPFPLLPITVEAVEDPEWEEYDEMMQALG